MLALCGEPFSYVHVNLREGEHKKPDYLAKNRFGQVPCLAVGGKHLCQSAAILEYLADALGKFSGRTADDRARIREWLFWDFDRLAPGIYRSRAIKRGFRSGTPDVAAMYEMDAKAGLSVLDHALAGAAFLLGTRPTIADVSCYGVVHYAPDAGVDLSPYPSVAAWMRRIEKLRGFAAPEDVLPKESRA
jgi:glutathione S-transferase